MPLAASWLPGPSPPPLRQAKLSSADFEASSTATSPPVTRFATHHLTRPATPPGSSTITGTRIGPLCDILEGTFSRWPHRANAAAGLDLANLQASTSGINVAMGTIFTFRSISSRCVRGTCESRLIASEQLPGSPHDGGRFVDHLLSKMRPEILPTGGAPAHDGDEPPVGTSNDATAAARARSASAILAG